MNEGIKSMAISLLEEAQDVASSIDILGAHVDIIDQLEQIVYYIEKAKTGISKVD